MKSDYLQQQVNNCRNRWDQEMQRKIRELEAAYRDSEQVCQKVEQDIARYFRYYNIGFIIRKLLLYILLAVIAAAIASYADNSIAAGVFMAVLVGAFFLKRYPAAGVRREDIRRSPELRFLLNPSLFDVIRTRLNRGRNADANRKKLEAEKAACEENIRRVREDTEASREAEIARLKSDFQNGLKRESAAMQSSQYPVLIRQSIMPEVQKMLRSHRVMPASLSITAQVEPDHVTIRTSTGLERQFSFSACGLAALNGFMKQIVLATLTARQIELEVAKYAPGVNTRVDQNDNTSIVFT